MMKKISIMVIVTAAVTLLVGGGATLTLPFTAQQAEASICGQSLWDHVWTPSRLLVHSCTQTVKGVIESVGAGDDGDDHMRVKVDSQYGNLLNTGNIQNTGGDLLAEAICQHTPTTSAAIQACGSFRSNISIPPAGTHVTIIGSWVLDQPNGWNEIHPVSSITTVTLNSISTNVPWGKSITVSGRLTASNAGGSTGGIGGKTITFNGTGGANLPSVTTNTDGTYSSTGAAPSTVGTGWTVQAHFAGDSSTGAADSNIRSYNTVKHTVSLALSTVPNTPWSRPTSFTATLTDASNGGTPISGKTVSFNGTGVIPSPQSGTTDSTGKATVTGTAPSTVATGWTYEAEFAGDSLYSAKDSTIKTYSTIKHSTSLTLAISPTSVKGGGTYEVSGTLKDTTTATSLSGMTISFTATFPITINPTTTNSTGGYNESGLTAPITAGSYNIQAHFAGTALYNAKDSAVHTLTVTSSTSSTWSANKASPTATKTSSKPTNPINGIKSNNSTNTVSNTNTTTTPVTSTTHIITIPKHTITTTTTTMSLTRPHILNTSSTYKIPKNAFTTNPSKLAIPNPFVANHKAITTHGVAASGNSNSTAARHTNMATSPAITITKHAVTIHKAIVGSSSAHNIVIQNPIANAGPDQKVTAGSIVTLNGRASHGTITSYLWRQLGGQPYVVLNHANTATPTFFALKVAKTITLTFELTVSNEKGITSSDTVNVVVMQRSFKS